MDLTSPKKPSPADMQRSAIVPELFNDSDYAREVLGLKAGETEDALDEQVMAEADALGIVVLNPPTAMHKAQLSFSDSAFTVSSSSRPSTSTRRTTPRASLDSITADLELTHPVSFAEYDKFAAQFETNQSCNKTKSPAICKPAPSVFSVSSRLSYSNFKSRLRRSRRMTRSSFPVDSNICVCCREEFNQSAALHTLSCGHKYCAACLRVLVTHSIAEEAKMPPRCCSFALPSAVIREILPSNKHAVFMKAVNQYATPHEERIFCPDKNCSEFIPKRKIDPKHPSQVVCPKCDLKVCSICKRKAHVIGEDCPADLELEAILEMGQKRGWRRCYNCRNLVELTEGCSHIVCRCRAQWCWGCGSKWDQQIGCPNFCNGEEELERRRLEDEARAAELEAAKAQQDAAAIALASENLKARKRSEDNEEMKQLRSQQVQERALFIAYERKVKWLLWTRQSQQKVDLQARHNDAEYKMRDRHAKTHAHLDDLQITAEMELRESLKMAEKSVRIRLKHMEAYCDGLGRQAQGENPARVVTERDLRELGLQYNIRDDLERIHQARINVMREKQGKEMEKLLERQEQELNRQEMKKTEELECLEERFVEEEDGFHIVFGARRERLRRRWSVREEILRARLEKENGVKYGPLERVVWSPVQMGKAFDSKDLLEGIPEGTALVIDKAVLSLIT